MDKENIWTCYLEKSNIQPKQTMLIILANTIADTLFIPGGPKSSYDYNGGKNWK